MFVRGFRKAAVSLVAVVAALNLVLPAAAGATDFNLTASPLPIDLSVKPGGVVTTPLKVQNTGTEQIKISVSLKKFSAKNDSGQPEITDPGPNDDFVHWVSFSQTSLTAQPNVWYTINMTIRPPKDAGFGYYYAVVFSEEGSDKKLVTPGVHSTVNGAVASLVLLDVNVPGESRTLNVKSFVSAKKVYEYLPSSFTVRVHNSGNVHAVPGGTIFISKNAKSNIAALDVNTAGGNILPGTDRVFKVDWNDGFPSFQTVKEHGQILSDEQGRPLQRLNWNGLDFNKFRFGRYHAHLVLTYNDGTRDIPVEGELSFWVIPWKLLLVVLLVVLLIGTGIFFVARSGFKRAKRIGQKQ